MPTPDPNHLAALIGAAKAHAETLGPEADEALRLLTGALAAARGIAGRGQADEGIRPQNLTTENDGGIA